MDKGTPAGTDFNRYVNGTWLDTYEIPADKSRFGIFDELRDRSTAQVKDIIEDLSAQNAQPGSLEHKVGAFYKTWMNTSALNDLAATPLDQHLGEIAGIEDSSTSFVYEYTYTEDIVVDIVMNNVGYVYIKLTFFYFVKIIY